MKELSKNELMEVEGGLFGALIEILSNGISWGPWPSCDDPFLWS